MMIAYLNTKKLFIQFALLFLIVFNKFLIGYEIYKIIIIMSSASFEVNCINVFDKKVRRK